MPSHKTSRRTPATATHEANRKDDGLRNADVVRPVCVSGALGAAGDGLSSDDLYDLLGVIGTKNMSIQPFILEQYPRLFTCPQVYLRVHGEATPVQLAEAAYQAITEAISMRPAKTDELIAAAILGADRFEGLTVGECLTKLGNLPQGCSQDTYKKNRKRVLQDVVAFLMRDDAPRVQALPVSPFENDEPDDSSHGCLVELLAANAGLYYAGLTSLFLHHFSSRLAQGGYRRYVGVDACDGFASYLFDAYANFYVASYAVMRSSVYARPDLLSHINRSALDRLVGLVHSAETHDPFTAADDGVSPENACEQPLLLGWTGLHYRLMFWYCARRTLRGGKARATMINEMYELAWRPWYYHQLGVDVFWGISRGIDGATQPSQIEALTEIGREAYSTVSGYIDFEQPFLTTAHRRASKTIAYHFEVDDWLPAIEGRSLREHVDSFFETHKHLAEKRTPVLLQ